MKAYLVKDKDEFCATVVFAETVGKARALAMSTECCEDVDFCDIQVKRQPQLDKYYVDGKRKWIGLIHKIELYLLKSVVLYVTLIIGRVNIVRYVLQKTIVIHILKWLVKKNDL